MQPGRAVPVSADAGCVIPEPAEQELWRDANEMLRLHGADAAIMAARKADELFGQSDLDGAHHWRVVVRRINILLERPYGPLH